MTPFRKTNLNWPWKDLKKLSKYQAFVPVYFFLRVKTNNSNRFNFLLKKKKDISYNNAVCYYKLRQYDNSLKHIADIIEKGIKEHPGNQREKKR